MVPGKVEVVGIALSAGEAALRPLQRLETDIQSLSSKTAGKIFVGIQGLVAGEIVLGLSVDGERVEVESHEKEGGTHVEVSPPGKFEPYEMALPMRIIGPENQVFPATHKITVLWGNNETMDIGWQGAGEFELVITGTAPKVKYDPVKDSD